MFFCRPSFYSREASRAKTFQKSEMGHICLCCPKAVTSKCSLSPFHKYHPPSYSISILLNPALRKLAQILFFIRCKWPIKERKGLRIKCLAGEVDEQNWLSVRWQAEVVCESESVYLTIEIPFISITQEWRLSKTRCSDFSRKTGRLNFYLRPNVCKCGQPFLSFFLSFNSILAKCNILQISFQTAIYMLDDVDGYEDSALIPEQYVSSCRIADIRKKGGRDLRGRRNE